MNKTTFIYALTCPDTGEVRYVGKANDPQYRLREHIGQYEPYHTPKSIWIKSLLDSGKRPAIVVLEEVPFDEWESAERRWIQYYHSSGASLTNIAGTKNRSEAISRKPRTLTKEEISLNAKLNYKAFGLAIFSYRNTKHIGVIDFSNMVGISRGYLSMIERGWPHNFSIELLPRLAGAMQTDPCELLKILTNHDAD